MDVLILRLGLALAIGLLVGLERGWREREAPEGSRAAGIRTYGISGLFGGVLATLSQELGSPLVFAAGLFAFALIFGWYDWQESIKKNSYSVTSVVAGLAVVALGGLAVTGDYRVAAAAGAALAGLLGGRSVLHGMLRHLTWEELRSALLLAAMTAIVLPVLPNHTIDPWHSVNPFEIWLFTVLTAALSYAGYIAVRLLGPGRGLLVSSLLGAVVSSTAVTVVLSRRAAHEPAQLGALAGGTMLAAMVSVLRVLVLVSLVRGQIVSHLAVPALVAALVFGIAGTVQFARFAYEEHEEHQHGNPFDIEPLVIFALGFVAVSAAGGIANQAFGAVSVVVTSAIAGLMDADVASLSAARTLDIGVPMVFVTTAILSSIAANAVTHVVTTMTSGRPRYFVPVLTVNALAVLLAGIAFVFNPLA